MRKLVRLWKRPTHDGQKYTYYLIYYDLDGRRKQKALGHTDKRKAEKQCTQLARELRMGRTEVISLRLSEFLEDSLSRTRGQIRENTYLEYSAAMKQFIQVVGNIDYDYIQKLRQKGKWSQRRGLCPATNFRYQFKVIMKKAGIEKGEFNDLRRTCLTNWLANGLSEFDVMTMAGHASFETTRRFYLTFRSDLLDRARKASSLGGVGRGITPRPQPQTGHASFQVMVLACLSSFATTHKFYLVMADDLVHSARVAIA